MTSNQFFDSDAVGTHPPSQLLAFLQPIGKITKPSRQGLTSQVVFVESGRGEVVIKHAIDIHLTALRREYAVLQSLIDLPLPLPLPLLYVELADATPPSGWLVMSRLPGVPLLDLLRAEIDEKQRNTLIHNLALNLAQLHQTPAPHSLQPEGTSWLNQMLGQAKHNLKIGVGMGSEEDLGYLHRAKPSSVRPVLIHGDLFLDNVLAKNEHITGFIDWAFGSSGDYRYDLTLALYDLSAREQEVFAASYGEAARLPPEVVRYFATLGAFF